MSLFRKLFKKRSVDSPASEEDPLLNYILDKFDTDFVGIELEKLGPMDFQKTILVSKGSELIIEQEILNQEISEISPIVNTNLSLNPTNAFLFKIKCIDQAINEYVGPTFFTSPTTWLKETIEMLSTDRADQNGDTIVVIFDTRMQWAISFTLSQDYSTLTIERFISHA